jgi:hypothetical protein
MIIFDENTLKLHLESLDGVKQTIFAASASTRLLNIFNSLRLTNYTHTYKLLNDMLDKFWFDILAPVNKNDKWLKQLEVILSLIPEESDVSNIMDALLDDAASSFAYSIRCFLNPHAQEAAWAARRAYEAADQVAIKILNIQPGLQTAEKKIALHEVVQLELYRQKHDIILLRDGFVLEVRANAYRDCLLTERELSLLLDQ